MLIVRVVEVIVGHATGDEPTYVLRQRYAKIGINHWLGHITEGFYDTALNEANDA